MSNESPFFRLEPEVAGKMPLEKVWFELPEIIRAFGISAEELRADLAAGHITATGRKTETGYDHVRVRGDELLRWMVLTQRKFVI
jgi:hypothetical protein